MAIYAEDQKFSPQASTGEKIKKYRLSMNLSQVEVASQMKKSPVWLSKIETDQREIKTSDLIKICEIFQIEISELLGISNKVNTGYRTILQNVLSTLPNEIPVYKTSELDKLYVTKEPVTPTMYAYWDPNIFSDDALGLFVEDDSNSPDINSGDRIYINTGWSPELTKVRHEALVRRIKHNTLWLLEILSQEDSSANFGGKTYRGSTLFHPYISEEVDTMSWPGDSLKVLFNEAISPTAPNSTTLWPGIYNGDPTSSNYNPLGWYSYKIVVKQQQQEYYNVYLPGVLAGYPDLPLTDSSANPIVGNPIEFAPQEIGKTYHAVLINDNLSLIHI